MLGSYFRRAIRSVILVEATSLLLLVGAVFVTVDRLTRSVWGPNWKDGRTLRRVNRVVSETVGTEAAALWIGVGIAMGLMLVWAFDIYKRWQLFGPLTFVAAVAHAAGIGASGITPTTPQAVVLFAGGTLVGVQIGGIPILNWIIETNRRRYLPSRPFEFKRAPWLAFLSVTGLVTIGLFDAYAAGGASSVGGSRAGLPRGVVVSGLVLSVIFYWFTDYEHKVRIIQLGPARSGKTSLAGGLFLAADAEGNRDVGESKLKQVTKNMNREGSFPPRDRLGDGASAQSFDYISKGYLYRKKITVAGVDYPGEAINSPKSSVSAKLNDDNETESNRSPSLLKLLYQRVRAFLRPQDDWESAINDFKSASREGMASHLAELVQQSDIIVFLLPMDDFLAPVLEGNSVPKSLTGYKIRELDRAETYEIEPIEGTEDAVRVRRQKGKLVHESDGSEYQQFAFESVDHLITLDENRHLYLEDRSDRQDPDEYLSEYESVIDHCAHDRTKSFVWVATKTDTVKQEFKNATDSYERSAQHTELDRHSGTLDRYLNTDDIEQEAVNKFVDNVPEEMNDMWYRTFAQWVRREYLETARTGFDLGQELERTCEDFVYPVWFDVERDGDELRIRRENRTESDKLLRGGDRLLNRFDGRGLIKRVPVGRYLIRRAARQDVRPVSQRAYDRLHRTYTTSGDDSEDGE